MAVKRFRTRFGSHPGHKLYVPGESKTRQSEVAASDIKVIFSKYAQTGQLPAPRNGWYGDISGISDAGSYQEALNGIVRAQERFSEMPSDLRDRFGNDPMNLLAFLDDPANRAQAAELGLVNPPVATPPVSPAPAAPSTPPASSVS